MLFSLCFNSEAQQEQEITGRLKSADSGERIRSLCFYYDSNLHSQAPEKFDNFLAECYRIADKDNDKAFRAYIDFYKRVRAIMLIADTDFYVRTAKMLPIWGESLEYYQAIGDEHFIAICHAYIGHIYFTIREYAKSMEQLLIADQVFQKVGYNNFPDMSKHLHNMALVFFFFRHYVKVAELMEASARIPPYSINYDNQRFYTLGVAYTHLKKYKEAKKAFTKALETAITNKDPLWTAIATQGQARLSLKQENYYEALNLYNSRLSVIDEVNKEANNGYGREYSEYLLGLAKTCVFLNDLSTARQYLDRISYKNYKKNFNARDQLIIFGLDYQDINYWLDFYDVKHRYHHALKDYYKSYHYLDSLYSIKYKMDSLFNGLQVLVAENRIQAKDKQYENAQKEAIIVSKNQEMFFVSGLLGVIVIATILLVRKNREINKQNKVISTQVVELSKTLEQKQILLSELQHRVKNNLQHVISILEIQKESVDFHNIDELIRENQNRIHSMALLHKKLNVSDNVNAVDFERYITELSALVKESYDNQKKKITLNVSCEIETLSIEKALPLGLIIVELVSNSMKHAFKKRNIGIISIEFSKTQTGYKCYYGDSGDGFDFNKTSEKGLGQEIIKGLIDQVDGAVETSNKNGFELAVYFK